MGDGAHEHFLVYQGGGGGDALRKASLCCEYFALVDQPRYRRDGREGHDVGEQEVHQGIIPCSVVGLCIYLVDMRRVIRHE